MVQALAHFLSPFQIDESKLKFITTSHFLMNCGLDLIVVIFSFIVWRYILYVPMNKMKIPIARSDSFYIIGTNSRLINVIRHIRGLLKQMVGMGDNQIIKRCGYEYFTYLFFLRRLVLLMGILMITDLCVWIPYQLLIRPVQQFSLVTMPSTSNNDFRTFYSIWVAFLIMYGMNDMKKHLKAKFMYRSFREVKDREPQKSEKRHLLNNLKSKTLHMQFLDGRFIDQASIKTQMQQYLVEDMEQQDRIIAVLAIPPYRDLLESEYVLKINKIVSEYGIQNLSWLWKVLKKENDVTVKERNERLLRDMRQKIQESYHDRSIKSCLIVVSRIETAQRLCYEFQIGKALCNICPDFGYASEEATWKVDNYKMIVRLAQEPNDLIWINMNRNQRQIFNFVLFNILCFMLLIISFLLLALTATDTYITLPPIIGPGLLVIINSTIRFLISKMVEWEQKTLRSDWEIKQFKMTIIYLIINVILGSIVRDTLNIISVLQTGWGWIELFSLIYKKADGLFYYLLILNQTALSFFTTLVKPGDPIFDVYQSGLWYEKLTQMKRKAIYGTNDSFRLGYSYSLAYLILAVVIIYSVSCPLIHFFGCIYFMMRLYLDTFTIAVFHEEELSSNLRFIQKVVQVISILIAFWIFLTATSMIFDKNYSNSIILYLFCGILIYYAAVDTSNASLKDARTDQIISTTDIRPLIEEWKQEYAHPFNATNYQYYIDAYYSSNGNEDISHPWKKQ